MYFLIIQLFNIFIILFLYYFPSYIYAVITPVTVVYRVDARSYQNVFRNGFTSWGSNTDFGDHFFGDSGPGGTQDSAFIATTTSIDFAYRYAGDMAYTIAYDNPSHNGFAYIYNIRATDNMYSAAASMSHIYNSVHESVPPVVAELLNEQQEWAALSSISNHQIRSVTVAEYYNHSIHYSSFINPYYHDVDTHSNDQPYEGSGDELPHGVEPLYVGHGIPAAFVSRANDQAMPTPASTFCAIYGGGK